MIDADRIEYARKVKLPAFTMLQGYPIEGVALLSGHSCSAVIEDAHRSCALVVHGIDERSET